jgi:hypothetical protein
MAVQYAFGQIVTQGLDLNVDAADPTSYPGTGTTWTSVVNRSITGSLVSCSFSSDFKGGIVFNNPSASVQFPGTVANYGTGLFTIEMAFRPSSINGIHYLVSKNSGSFPNWGVYLSGSGGSGKLFAEYRINASVSCSVSSSTVFVTGSNYFVDVQLQPGVGVLIIYKNGQLETSATGNGIGSLATTSSLFIGNITPSSPQSYLGSLFTLKLYLSSVFNLPAFNYNTMSNRFQLPINIPIIPSSTLNKFPGASAAYSLRLLNGLYQGPAIEVRRTDNVSASIGFTVEGDLDVAALQTFIGSNSGFIKTWYDQSGNSINLTQSTSSQQPRIINNGSLFTVNNKPGVNFIDSQFLTYNGAVVNTYVYTVSKLTATNTLNTLLNTTFNVGDRGNIRIDNANYYRAPSTFGGLDGGDYAGATGGVGQMFFNGNLHTTLNNATNQHMLSVKRGVIENNNGLSLGNSNGAFRPYNGNIQEVIFYTLDQTSRRTDMEADLNTYYNIY